MTRSLPQADRPLPLLSTTAEYALRALAELAIAPPAEQIRSVDLAARTGVPEAYLSKVLRKLVSHGLLHGSKGHGGGFSLAKPAGRIRFIDVLEAVDSMPATERCAFGRPRCSTTNPCPLHPAWARLKHGFLEWAQTTTLAEVTGGAARGGSSRKSDRT